MGPVSDLPGRARGGRDGGPHDRRPLGRARLALRVSQTPGIASSFLSFLARLDQPYRFSTYRYMPKSRPRLKIIRRFGIQLPGLTRKSAEKKPYPPGQHGQSTAKRRKTSE